MGARRGARRGSRPAGGARPIQVNPSAGIVLSWSGGKDSALALHALGPRVDTLLTTVTDGYERISMHGVRVELLRAQARAANRRLVEVRIPPDCSNEIYEDRMRAAVAGLSDVEAFAFGDLFLEDVRAYREARFPGRAMFPLWGRRTEALAREFVRLGFRAWVCTVDPRVLDARFAGRAFDDSFLDELPATVDPCGENGEFHTFVWDGPMFDNPVACTTGAVVVRDGFVFADILATTT